MENAGTVTPSGHKQALDSQNAGERRAALTAASLSAAWGVLALLAGIALFRITGLVFLEDGIGLLLLGSGFCAVACGAGMRRPWAGWTGIPLCLSAIIYAYRFPFIVSRNVFIIIVLAMLALLGALILGWGEFRKNGQPEPSTNERAAVRGGKRRKMIAAATVGVVFAAAWYAWSRSETRGMDNGNRFVVSPFGTIADNKTGLEWQVGPKAIEWDGAKDWAENLEADGGGYRLPTYRELRGLYWKGMGALSINPIFGLEEIYVWTAETKRSSLAGYYCLPVGKRLWNHIGPGHQGQVLAVRNRIN